MFRKRTRSKAIVDQPVEVTERYRVSIDIWTRSNVSPDQGLAIYNLHKNWYDCRAEEHQIGDNFSIIEWKVFYLCICPNK